MKKVILLASIAVFLLGGLFLFDYSRFNDGKLHVIFCDVGQGDAILIKTPTNKHILIDAGPDRKVLNCLAEHLPFWERDIDLFVLTHPHADHFMGMYFILERYNVTQFATEKLINKSDGFGELMRMVEERGIPVKCVAKGDRWILPEVEKSEARNPKSETNSKSETRKTQRRYVWDIRNSDLFRISTFGFRHSDFGFTSTAAGCAFLPPPARSMPTRRASRTPGARAGRCRCSS